MAVQPFYFKGKDHKSAARLLWEEGQRRLAQKKGLKAKRKRLARHSSNPTCPAQRRGRLIRRCRILSGESAQDALERSLAESGLEMREWYRQIYLHSHHWQDLRAWALSKQGCFCQACRQPAKTLDAHHERYRNIFDVEVADLKILCRSCHDTKHPPT